MGRLIDACKVIEKINGAIELLGIASKTAAENEGFQTTIKAYKDVRDAIMQEPTAEPERKTGKWNVEFNGAFRGGAYWFSCSRCKRIVPEVRNNGWNFCPRCGADMRGEQDEAD